jgi:DNA-binding NarL/FixJ family response regulator
MNTEVIRIVIADDQPNFRRALRMLLEKEPDLCVVAEAGNGVNGIKLVEKHNPDVILMDLNMPGMGGLAATEIIMSRFPDTRVITLSMYSDDSMRTISSQTGACYFLSKDCSPKEIIAAIRSDHHNLQATIIPPGS